MVRTRFAPSPNGPLHLGHAYAAMVAHDQARARGGSFHVRIEDIDGTRSRPEMVDEALADLVWLGLDWDADPVFQSARFGRYEIAAQRLREIGVLYPCRCSRSEIAAAATRTGHDGPVYPGTCRGLEIDPAGASWRLDVEAALALTGPLSWEDATLGRQDARPDLAGDVVLVRKDLPASYHLAVTLDDAADGIDLVTRGMDLFAATHLHRLLQALLDLPVPVWHHHALLVDAEGRKLAKRRGSPSLGDRRRAGGDGRAVIDALRRGVLPTGISLSQALD